jgi:hypothetical protein
MLKFLRWTLISLAVLATLVSLFYAEENFRGKHAWDRYRQELESRGEQLDWKAFIPKPVPDDQNFASIPLIQSWFVRSNSFYSNYWRQDNYGRVDPTYYISRSKFEDGDRHFTDLVAWELAFDALRHGGTNRWDSFRSDKLDLASRAKAAPTVLEGLKTNEAIFADLRAASQRPYSRYPINYDVPDPADILLSHLNSVRRVCWRLELKACAELAVGQSETASDDVKLMLYLADSVKEEPFVVSYLVRVACVQLAIQPIWEGLAEHAWSDAQLQELQSFLARYNFAADLKETFDAERAYGIGVIEFVRKNSPGPLIELIGSVSSNPMDKKLASWFGGFIPRGWYYEEQLNYCTLYQLELGGTFDPATERVFPTRIKANERAFYRQFSGGRTDFIIHHRMMAGLLIPALSSVVRRAATAQTAADQAALGCALERYRLANGQFPERVDELVPAFVSQLPHDVITGEPYKYRRTDDGQFILYSVGWDGKDDGGVPGKTLFDSEHGDWVWQYPPQGRL